MKKEAGRRYIFLTVLTLCCALRPAFPVPPWTRHTIDRSSRGADGVRLHDVNGDGLPDITTGWEEGGIVRVYRNPGPKLVRLPWPAVTVGTVASPEDAVFADLDADGAVDVVSACEGRTRSIFLHWAPRRSNRYLDAAGWTTAVLPASRNVSAWMFCLPLDVDGKRGPDLVAGAKGENARVGCFVSPPQPRRLADWEWVPLYDAGWIMSLVAHDVDGDGDQDIVLSDRKGPARGVKWLENPGPRLAVGRRWACRPIGGAGKQVMFLCVADLDLDGRTDVVTAVSGKELIFSRRVSQKPLAWKDYPVALPAAAGLGKGVAVGDIDRDGKPDIVFSCEHARGAAGVMWLASPGDPTAREWIPHDISGAAEGIKFDRLELLDLDADGDLDVLTCEESHNLGVIWYENPHQNVSENAERREKKE